MKYQHKAHMKLNKYCWMGLLIVSMQSCIPNLISKNPDVSKLPDAFTSNNDTLNTAKVSWRDFFKDTCLIALIDSAIQKNPENQIALQEIEIAANEVSIRHAQLTPSVRAGGGMGVDKAARYTSEGAGNASTEMTPGHEIPEPLTDLNFGLQASWEADIWHKIRNSKKSAVEKYLASQEGRSFVVTNLVAEVANSYYELRALDNQLKIVREAIQLQQRELDIVKAQKDAARATELAVKQFEAQVYKAEGMQNEIEQQIIENENRINFLLGRFSQPIKRDTTAFMDHVPDSLHVGLPTDLLMNRPDVRQAAHVLKASGYDISVAKAEFLPSLSLDGALGYRAYKPGLLLSTPESFLFSLAGNFFGPIINRTALMAEYKNANLRQKQSLLSYQTTLLNSYREVVDQLASQKNLKKTFDFKNKQVVTLTKAIEIAHDLFLSARADYLEVLTAQKEALDAKLELNETMKNRLTTQVNLYRALGGGWK